MIGLSNWKADTDVCFSSFTYTYDNEGNRLSMDVGPEWESFTGLNDYDYDDIYQLTAVDSPEFSAYSDTTFTYDSMGNRLEVVFVHTPEKSGHSIRTKVDSESGAKWTPNPEQSGQ